MPDSECRYAWKCRVSARTVTIHVARICRQGTLPERPAVEYVPCAAHAAAWSLDCSSGLQTWRQARHDSHGDAIIAHTIHEESPRQRQYSRTLCGDSEMPTTFIVLTHRVFVWPLWLLLGQAKWAWRLLGGCCQASWRALSRAERTGRLWGIDSISTPSKRPPPRAQRPPRAP